MEIYTALDFNFQKLNKCGSNQLRTFFLIKIQIKNLTIDITLQ